MTARQEVGWDRLAVSAVVIAVIMSVLYVWLLGQQGDGPAVWFLGGLVTSTLFMAYGASRAAPSRGTALAIAGTALTLLGIAGLASIGLPVVVAGVLALIAAARNRAR
jgi:hypothetical protein